MCRYGILAYKPHLSCFRCRKTFKRRLRRDIGKTKNSSEKEAKCPECGGLLADMGLDFKSPSQKDTKAWVHLLNLYTVGITFHSCGCSGPGYIPKDENTLIEYLEKTRNNYINQLRSWINYIEPQTKREYELRKQKNTILHPPFELTQRGTRKVTKEEVVHYWSYKIKEIEKNIYNIKNKI